MCLRLPRCASGLPAWSCHHAEMPPDQPLCWCCTMVTTEPCTLQEGRLRQEGSTTRQRVLWG